MRRYLLSLRHRAMWRAGFRWKGSSEWLDKKGSK